MIIVDASVAVKWFIPEQGSQQATALLRQKQRMVSPEIIRIEVAAALTRRLRTKELDEATTELLLNDWQEHLTQQVVALEATGRDFDAATKLSIQLRHQLQDCLYLAVANRLQVPLITADDKFIKKAAPAGYDVVAL